MSCSSGYDVGTINSTNPAIVSTAANNPLTAPFQNARLFQAIARITAAKAMLTPKRYTINISANMYFGTATDETTVANRVSAALAKKANTVAPARVPNTNPGIAIIGQGGRSPLQFGVKRVASVPPRIAPAIGMPTARYATSSVDRKSDQGSPITALPRTDPATRNGSERQGAYRAPERQIISAAGGVPTMVPTNATIPVANTMELESE